MEQKMIQTYRAYTNNQKKRKKKKKKKKRPLILEVCVRPMNDK